MSAPCIRCIDGPCLECAYVHARETEALLQPQFNAAYEKAMAEFRRLAGVQKAIGVLFFLRYRRLYSRLPARVS